MATDRFGKDLYVWVEQASHCQQQFRALPLLLTFQNIPGVGMTKHICNPKAVPDHFLVFGNAVICEEYLPQQIADSWMVSVSCANLSAKYSLPRR